MSAIRKFAGQTAIYGLSTIASRILNFFLTPVYTTVYAPKAYGIFTTMYAWASVLNAFMAFGMETTFFRYINKKEGQKEQVYSNAFFLIVFLACCFIGFAFLFLKPIAAWMQEGKSVPIEDYISYIKYFIFILALDALSVIPFARVRAEGKAVRYALIKFTNIASFIALNLFFLFAIPFIIKENWLLANWFSTWYRAEWIGYVFISNLIASGLTFLLLLPEILKLQFKVNRTLLIDMFSYSWPILIANLSFIINENSDKIFLEKLLPAEISEREVGIYGACAKLAVFLSIFINAFRLGAEPFFFNTSKNKDAKETYAVIMSYFVIALALVYVGLVANIGVLKYFIGQSYWEGIYVVPILLLGYLNLGIYMNLSIWYKLSDQTKYGLYISGIGALATIVLNVAFIPKFGFVASAWISLCVYTLMMLLSYIWGQKHYPIPYRIKKDLLYIVLATVLVYISFSIFKQNIFVGNILFVSFGIFVFYLERHNIKTLFVK